MTKIIITIISGPKLYMKVYLKIVMYIKYVFSVNKVAIYILETSEISRFSE